jgi:PAS domain S-box-containing protein
VARKLNSKILADAGIGAVIVADGTAALEYARDHNVSLMLLDRRMPGMSGIEVLEQLRQDPRTRRLPVILLTAASDTTELVQGLDAGADDYLAKPVNAAELVAHVRAVLRGRAGEAEIRRVVDRANDAYVSWDETSLITEWNARATEVFGWERHEVLGQPLASTIIAPTSRGLHEERIRRFSDSGDSPLVGEWIELAALHRNGGEIPVEMTIWTVTSGSARSFHALFRDLSRRREMESAFDHNTSLRELMDGGPDMITLSDASGLFYVSPACRTTLGYEPDELIRGFGRDLIHPDDLEAALNAHDQALVTNGPFSSSMRLRAKDGNYVWLESRGFAVRDGDPSVTVIHAVWRDISQRVRITEERARIASLLEAANATLAETVDREHRAVEELQQLDRAKTDFVSTVSHELRTPLASIVGYAEILSDQCATALDFEQALAVQVIERNARRLLTMIEDLLLIGRVEAGELKLAPLPAALGPIIEAAASAVMPTAQAQGIEVRVNLPILPELVADAAHIDRVLLNLLSNAIKFTLPGGHVAITATVETDHVAITVGDDGIGIAPEDRAKLFDRFFRGSEATERAIQGSGLGLFIVQHIVELHDGSVSVRSVPERGTDVTFTLPIARVLELTPDRPFSGRAGPDRELEETGP